MVRISKVCSLLLLSQLQLACGDIVRVANPFKSKKRSQPEGKYSADFGVCSNFHGSWSMSCEENSFVKAEDFALYQDKCNQVMILNQNRSFSRDEMFRIETEEGYV
ncbi:MAG: hypothetical protein ACOH5I_06630 [Oligoflexus sp.]